MKNIADAVTFAENPLGLVRKVALIGVLGFIVLVVALAIFRLPLDNNGNEITEKFVIVILGIMIAIVLLLFFIRSFAKKRTVTCDSRSCDIDTTNFWNTFHESESFVWSDVTDTSLTEEYVDKSARSIFVDVESGGRMRRLLSSHQASRDTFHELIKFVNDATPHLNYVWEKTKDFGDRQVVVEVHGFSKVARN